MIPNQRLSLSGAFFTITFLLLANCEQAFANPLDQLATELKNAVNRGIEEGLKKGGVQNGSRHSAPRESTQERQERYQNLRNQATARQNGSGSAQQIVQQTKSENVENEIFSEEELAEIEQYIYDGPSRSKEVDLNTIFHQQKSWNNPLTGYSYVPLMKQAPGFRQLTAIKGFYSITCRYKPGSVSSATIDSATFWYRRRPINSISPSRYWLDGKLQIFDIAIEHCPETVGAMYQMTYGEDVLARATETGEHAKEQRRLYSAMSSEERENYKIEQKRALNPGWNKDSKANPADQDRQLATEARAQKDEAERKERIAKSLEPSEDDVVRVLVAEKVKLSRSSHVGEHDTLVKSNPALGELARIRFSIVGLRCKSDGKKKNGASCSFTAEREIVGGFLGPLAPLGQIGGKPQATYSARFLNGKNGWYSPDLAKAVLEESAKNSSSSTSQSDSYTGGWSKGKYKCRGGRLEDNVTGESMPFFHPDC